MADATPLILDVDTGVDDALAIGLAVSRPDVDLLAVSTLAGNIDVINATENSRRVLGLIGASAIPVHQGASRPLSRVHRNAAHYHGMNGLGDAQLPEVDAPLGPDRGPAAIIRLARQRPGEIVLVATGPLTNIAIALNVFPELPSLLKRFVVMGGSYRNPGNITPHAEFNIWADPEAAQQVFSTDFPEAIAVGLDVSHQTLLLKASWEESGGKSDALARLLTAVCRRSFVDRAQADFPLHDPLATAVALDPALVATERGVIDVVTDGERDGKTTFTADPSGSWQVALGVDSGRFVSEFLASYQLSAQ
ncbi:MAG TPA: nucleoside hydrolase [Thermomicrobiales bacterium]|nr:nucleoside hydrolase [Thermomicrobiales bacterium]